jgi:glutamyl-tRNA synthetase
MKTYKRTAEDIAAAASLAPSRVSEWMADSSKQLDLPEQSALMRVIGLREADLPEILVHDFRKNGYLPETLLNFLALLGWNPGGDRERMTMDELVQLFSIEGIGKGNAKFDRGKLLAFNTEALKEAPTERLVRALRDYLSVNPDSPLNRATDEDLARVIDMKRGVRTLRELDDATRFFFTPDDQIEYEPAAIEKVLKKNEGEGLKALRDVQDVLKGLPEWTAAALESAVQRFCETSGLGLGKVAQPIRVAISGTTVSPPIFQSLELLGRERTFARIGRCLDRADSST